ncbi:hypothetical protein Tco_1234167 [Tanacetum coccineum]
MDSDATDFIFGLSLSDGRSLDVDLGRDGWSKLIPVKVNIMGWRLSIDKLPTRVNLDARGIDVPSVLCPVVGYSYSEMLSTMV